MQPYYSDDKVTLYHGSCDDVLPHLAGVGADLVFTSPPYNLGTSTGGGFGKKSVAARDLDGGYGTYDDAMPQDEYDAWQRAVVAACWSTLADDGAIFYNHKPRIQAGRLLLPLEYGGDLPLRQIITWDRNVGLNFSDSFYLPKYEWIVVWAHPKWRLRSRKACEIGDVWHVAPERGDASDHPAPFPLALPTLAIDTTGANLVLDPFAGSGTTLRAAKDLGRRAIGIELEERFCEIAAKRLGQEVLF